MARKGDEGKRPLLFCPKPFVGARRWGISCDQRLILSPIASPVVVWIATVLRGRGSRRQVSVLRKDEARLHRPYAMALTKFEGMLGGKRSFPPSIPHPKTTAKLSTWQLSNPIF
ncbi:MAG: hypothetical protein IAF02_19690 [Anaerolineae bacterium]|nr:hypothetical protein [Anaerolineae bacterium]